MMKIHLEYPGKKTLTELLAEVSAYPINTSELPTDTNLLLQADNLQAMIGLLPQYRGKIDLVYIDPPYAESTLSVQSH